MALKKEGKLVSSNWFVVGCLLLLVLALSLSLINAASYSVKVTNEHPFLLVNGKYVTASELKIGDELKTVDGKKARVTGIHDVFSENPFEVYNLETALFHDFVLPGGIVVHNSNAPDLFKKFFSDNQGERIDIVIIDDAGNKPEVIGPLQQYLANNPGADVNIMHYRPPSYTKPDAPVYFQGTPRPGAKVLIVDNDMVTGSAVENTGQKLRDLLGDKFDKNKIFLYLYRDPCEFSKPVLGSAQELYFQRPVQGDPCPNCLSHNAANFEKLLEQYALEASHGVPLENIYNNPKAFKTFWHAYPKGTNPDFSRGLDATKSSGGFFFTQTADEAIEALVLKGFSRQDIEVIPVKVSKTVYCTKAKKPVIKPAPLTEGDYFYIPVSRYDITNELINKGLIKIGN